MDDRWHPIKTWAERFGEIPTLVKIFGSSRCADGIAGSLKFPGQHPAFRQRLPAQRQPEPGPALPALLPGGRGDLHVPRWPGPLSHPPRPGLRPAAPRLHARHRRGAGGGGAAAVVGGGGAGLRGEPALPRHAQRPCAVRKRARSWSSYWTWQSSQPSRTLRMGGLKPTRPRWSSLARTSL